MSSYYEIEKALTDANLPDQPRKKPRGPRLIPRPKTNSFEGLTLTEAVIVQEMANDPNSKPLDIADALCSTKQVILQHLHDIRLKFPETDYKSLAEIIGKNSDFAARVEDLRDMLILRDSD